MVGPSFAAALLASAVLSGAVSLAQAVTSCDSLLGEAPYPPSETVAAARVATCTEKPCAMLARGLAHLTSGEVEEAREALAKAAELDPRSPWPSYYLCIVALRSGDTLGAVEAAERTVALAPNLAGAQALLGEARLVAGESEKALGPFRMAIALAPGRARGHLDMGRASITVGKPELAVIALKRAIELDASCHEACFLLARAQMNAGEVAQGCETLKHYLQIADGVTEEAERVERARQLLRRFSERG
jgi:tetratricopeptide (TPR) repeat protein